MAAARVASDTATTGAPAVTTCAQPRANASCTTRWCRWGRVSGVTSKRVTTVGSAGATRGGKTACSRSAPQAAGFLAEDQRFVGRQPFGTRDLRDHPWSKREFLGTVPVGEQEAVVVGPVERVERLHEAARVAGDPGPLEVGPRVDGDLHGSGSNALRRAAGRSSRGRAVGPLKSDALGADCPSAGAGSSAPRHAERKCPAFLIPHCC